MNDGSSILRSLTVWLAAIVLPILFLEIVQRLVGANFSGADLAMRLLFVLLALFVAWVSRPVPSTRNLAAWPQSTILLVGMGLLSGYLTGAHDNPGGAWALLAISYGLLINLDEAISFDRGLLPRWIVKGLLAGAAGAFAVLVAQVEMRFADEEFFVAVQALLLALLWLALRLAYELPRRFARYPTISQKYLHLKTRWILAALAILAVAGGLVAFSAYQHSFYSAEAPAFAGIEPDAPFLCGQATPDGQTYQGQEVHQRLLERVAAGTNPGPPEQGLLALGWADPQQAQAFRTSLLEEAEKGLFTGPANSVKFGQYEAALRAYYYIQVRQAFPGLFSVAEQEALEAWFAAINRRAQTTEWVDWMYAAAFAMSPRGPYENQENGAGLLALLESQGLADPNLFERNQAYLADNSGGWEQRFRNTDDAIIYQAEWIHNAAFQAQYFGSAPNTNTRLSFEWLLAQALPDGTPLRYNHAGAALLPGIATQGAALLEDGRYVWIAGRALDALEVQNKALPAMPFADQVSDMAGVSPSLGSCLMYGDSGLPNQVGPLAPDKIVFRDGWSVDSKYLLLNLRFTGWHRYKATNSIVLLYQNGPLVVEQTLGQNSAWLPAGRSLFRDKRIPRENLNGLLVERSGMSNFLHSLTGFGGPWAQDPPHYAEVEQFETGPELDFSHTLLKDWSGWEHRRGIYFYHSGPVVILDEAYNRSDRRKAAITWHVVGTGDRQEEGRLTRFRLNDGPDAAEMVLLPLSSGEIVARPETLPGDINGQEVQYQSSYKRQLSLATVFLTGPWTGASVVFIDTGGSGVLKIQQGDQYILLHLPEWIEKQ